MSYHHLTQDERRKIAILKQKKLSLRQIAEVLNRSPSTVSREIRRNSSIDHGNDGYNRSYYRYRKAQGYYLDRLHNKRSGKYENAPLCQYVREKALLAWSPEQIAGRIALDFPNAVDMRISHSTIYRWLHRGLIPQAALLQTKLRRCGHRHGEKRGQFHGVRELKSRSKQALKRTRLGDWEIDTIVSSDCHYKECLLNLVDRKSRFCVLVLLKNKSRQEMMRAFSVTFGKLPLLTITGDRGKENCIYNEFELAWPGARFYFTRPHSPWQKGTVENTNGLVRQFFRRGTNFHELSQEQVSQVMFLLNNRPRKCLGFRTPFEVLHFA